MCSIRGQSAAEKTCWPLVPPHLSRAEADQRELHSSEGACSTQASRDGAAEGHCVLPLTTGGGAA